MYLFDTDIISNILKKNPPLHLIKKFATISPVQQFTTAINVGELVYGAYKSHRPAYFLKKLEEVVLPNITVLPFDEKAAYTYGKVRAELEGEGSVVSEPDLRIAAIALTQDLILITGNEKHFSKIKELKLENWLRE